MKRLDERCKSGKVFADWLREELLATGDARECMMCLRDGRVAVYVVGKNDIERIARLKSGAPADIVDIIAERDESAVGIAYVESDLRDDKRDCSVVYHADCAVFLPPGACYTRLYKGDLSVRFPASAVIAKLREAKDESAEGDECRESADDNLGRNVDGDGVVHTGIIPQPTANPQSQTKKRLKGWSL